MTREERKELHDRLAGAVYGAVVGDLFREVDQETMKPVFADEFGYDMRDCIRYMSEYGSGSYPVVEYEGKQVTALLPDMLFYRRSMFQAALGTFSGHSYEQPYMVASKAIYDTVFMKQGRTTWERLNVAQKGSGGLAGLCDVWNESVALARTAYAFPDAVILSRNSKADGSVVGMLAGARFGLHSIPGRWVSAVPVQIKGILGSFIKSCMDYNGE